MRLYSQQHRLIDCEWIKKGKFYLPVNQALLPQVTLFLKWSAGGKNVVTAAEVSSGVPGTVATPRCILSVRLSASSLINRFTYILRRGFTLNQNFLCGLFFVTKHFLNQKSYNVHHCKIVTIVTIVTTSTFVSYNGTGNKCIWDYLQISNWQLHCQNSQLAKILS